MSYQTWLEQFKDQLQGLSESYRQSGSKLSLLGYALNEKRLSSADYLNWAMTQYKLPLLQSRFFTETSLSQEMFAKWATHYPWSEECLPVAEWDGSLIIACLQPPQDFPSNPSSIFVLAAFENLQGAWIKFYPEKATVPPPIADPAPNDGPMGIDLSMATIVQKSPSDSFSFDDLGLEADSSELESSDADRPEESSESSSSDENSEVSESANEGKLDGLFDAPAVIRLESLQPKTEASPANNLSSDNVSRDILPVNDIATNDISTESPHLSDAKSPMHLVEDSGSFPEIKLEVVDDSSSSSIEIPVLNQEILSPVVEKFPSPPNDEKLEQTGLHSENATINKTALRSTGIVKPNFNTTARGNFTLDKLKKKNSLLLSEKVKTTLSQMKTQFEKSMILTLDDQETQIVAFAWDESFQEVQSMSTSFPLKKPSIFNIVSSTQKAFHGYISPNQINEDFFADWNQGRIPDHVTITPILVNEKLVGMLMGFGTKSTYNKASLNLAEKLSTDFVKGLQAA